MSVRKRPLAARRGWSVKQTHAFWKVTINRDPTRCVAWSAIGRARFIVTFPTRGIREEVLQEDSCQELIQRQLQTDKELTKLRVLRTYLIKTHFIDDRFDIEYVVCKQANTPFRIIEAS